MNGEIRIEKAWMSDLNEIMEIENACFERDSFSRRQMIYLITHAKGIFLVAKHNEKTAGYISFTTSKRHNTGRIYSIAVSPAYRNSGIGGKLISSIITFAYEKHVNTIFLEVRTNNTEAISLYKKYGFTMHSLKKNYYHEGADAYSMTRFL